MSCTLARHKAVGHLPGQTGALGDARPPHTFLKCHRRDTVGSHSPSPTPPCPDRL